MFLIEINQKNESESLRILSFLYYCLLYFLGFYIKKKLKNPQSLLGKDHRIFFE